MIKWRRFSLKRIKKKRNKFRSRSKDSLLQSLLYPYFTNRSIRSGERLSTQKHARRDYRMPSTIGNSPRLKVAARTTKTRPMINAAWFAIMVIAIAGPCARESNRAAVPATVAWKMFQSSSSPSSSGKRSDSAWIYAFASPPRPRRRRRRRRRNSSRCYCRRRRRRFPAGMRARDSISVPFRDGDSFSGRAPRSPPHPDA